eukprot:6392098-Amphidinium_carterae.1
MWCELPKTTFQISRLHEIVGFESFNIAVFPAKPCHSKEMTRRKVRGLIRSSVVSSGNQEGGFDASACAIHINTSNSDASETGRRAWYAKLSTTPGFYTEEKR